MRKNDNLKGKLLEDVMPMWKNLSFTERDIVIDHVDDALDNFNKGMKKLAEDLRNKNLKKS